MEKRYTFGGFTFGTQGLFQLTISPISTADYGSTHGIDIGLELSPEERQELITLLLTIPQEKN
jgi:hypothetical protein